MYLSMNNYFIKLSKHKNEKSNTFCWYSTFQLLIALIDTIGFSAHKANVVKHVRVQSYSQSGRQLLQLLKSPSTLRNESN